MKAAFDDTKDFLGCGWTFPVSSDKATGRIVLAEYEEDIAQAITIILSTRRGERVMHPEFGGGLHDFVFESDSYTARSRIEQTAVEALALLEPLITDIDVRADFPNGQTGGRALLFVTAAKARLQSTQNTPYRTAQNIGQGDSATAGSSCALCHVWR